ncbi:MAG: hypothetical protein ACE5HT_04545 [Gemmatimonadales bacterium]
MQATRYPVATLLFLLSLSAPLAAQTEVDKISADIRYLSADTRLGRGVGTTGLDSAASFVARRFREVGSDPAALTVTFGPCASTRVHLLPHTRVLPDLPSRMSKAGDILIRLGDYDIKNLYYMTDALRSYKPSDVVSIAVLPSGERLSFTAILGKRGG